MQWTGCREAAFFTPQHKKEFSHPKVEVHWILLNLAIIAEVAGTTSMKLSAGFSKFMPSLLMFVFYGLGLSLMNFALRGVDVSIAYAIWSAHGMALIVTIGILFYSEQMTLLKLASILLIIAGVIGLNVGKQVRKRLTRHTQADSRH